MSGDGKRGVAEWPKLPRPSSTLPSRTRMSRLCRVRLLAARNALGKPANRAPYEIANVRRTRAFISLRSLPGLSELLQVLGSRADQGVRGVHRSSCRDIPLSYR
jgi:hypothetical protein